MTTALESATMNCYLQRYKTAKQRFEEAIAKQENGCWRWLKAVQPDGYGRFWINGKSVPSHRASWEFYRGEIPHGVLVLHRCDYRTCVNPDHLFLGNHKDNTQDMMAKGRDFKCRQSRRGTNSNFAKITAAQALEIFHAAGTQSKIAEHFGISQSAVSRIKLRTSWNWLTK